MNNTSGFKEFIKKINDTQRKIHNAIDETLEESALEGVAEIQSRTSVKTGNLRRSTIHGDVKVVGKVHSIKLGYDQNRAPYADAYENGHKQTQGRYVPAIGKKLVKEYVPGRHTVRDSLTIMQSRLSDRLKQKLSDIK